MLPIISVRIPMLGLTLTRTTTPGSTSRSNPSGLETQATYILSPRPGFDSCPRDGVELIQRVLGILPAYSRRLATTTYSNMEGAQQTTVC